METLESISKIFLIAIVIVAAVLLITAGVSNKAQKQKDKIHEED